MHVQNVINENTQAFPVFGYCIKSHSCFMSGHDGETVLQENPAAKTQVELIKTDEPCLPAGRLLIAND